MKEYKHILVALDLTLFDEHLIRYSAFLADVMRAEKVYFVHNIKKYEIPLHFSPYVSREDMHPRILQHTEKRFSRFLEGVHFSGSIHQKIIPGRDAGLASLLVQAAEKEKADLLVIADKGGNTFSSLVVGSTAGEIFHHDLRIPLWVVN